VASPRERAGDRQADDAGAEDEGGHQVYVNRRSQTSKHSSDQISKRWLCVAD
jgi:hypothetical protein